MTSSSSAPKRKNKPGAGPPKGSHNRVAALDKFHNFKECKQCGETKRLADFHKTTNWRKKRAADPKRYKTRCKDCLRAPPADPATPGFNPKRTSKPARVTPEQRRKNHIAYKRRARRETRIKALRYVAEKGCCECGERDPRVLEFDHIDAADKSHHVGRLLANGYSWGNEMLREEIRKCRVICANCHRKHTIVQQGYYSHKAVRAVLREIDEQYNITGTEDPGDNRQVGSE